jgi:hypothetical protein
MRQAGRCGRFSAARCNRSGAPAVTTAASADPTLEARHVHDALALVVDRRSGGSSRRRWRDRTGAVRVRVARRRTPGRIWIRARTGGVAVEHALATARARAGAVKVGGSRAGAVAVGGARAGALLVADIRCARAGAVKVGGSRAGAVAVGGARAGALLVADIRCARAGAVKVGGSRAGALLVADIRCARASAVAVGGARAEPGPVAVADARADSDAVAPGIGGPDRPTAPLTVTSDRTTVSCESNRKLSYLIRPAENRLRGARGRPMS